MFLLSLVLVLIVVHESYGNHFHGGSMSWKPINNGEQIQLTYRVGFKFYHQEAQFNPCTQEAQQDRSILRAGGNLVCNSCNGKDASQLFTWICDDYDLQLDSSVGGNVVVYDVPSGQTTFEISYEHCCWIDLESPVNRAGSAKGWKMMTHVNLKPRPDGVINSSPVSAPVPVEKFYKGCMYHLKLAVSDPDNDAIRCRYADPELNECPSKTYTKACGPPTDGLTINKKECTLDFDTTDIAEGYHAVNVIIEDYIRPVKRKSEPLSKVPLLFLLFVDGEDASCSKPSFVDPPSCKTVRPGETLRIVIRADPGDPAKPISKIKTQKPYGMLASEMENDLDVPNRMKVTLSWDTTVNDIGEYTVCYSALDYYSYTSGVSCTFLYVDDDPLRPVAERSIPPPDEKIEVGQTWVVEFNEQIQRPKQSAFIRIVEPSTGDIAYEVDATDPAVSFRKHSIEFTPSREVLLRGDTKLRSQYQLQIDEGVALTKSGGCGSEKADWEFAVKDLLSIGVTTPAPPPMICTSPLLEIIVPNETAPVGEDCLLHVDDGTIMMSYGEGVDAPYRLCCPGSCGNINVGPPGGPPGPPGTLQ